MKKSLLRASICLLPFSLTFCSCSSDDVHEESAEGRRPRQLTIAEVPTTRATLNPTADGKTIEAAWTGGSDKATFLNISALAVGVLNYSELTASSSAQSSAFTGNATCSLDDKFALVYPNVTPEQGKGGITINLSGQKGTLTDIARRYHYIYGVGTVCDVSGTTATGTISTMKSLLALCKFTFKDNTGKDIPVKTLSIGYGTDPDTGYPQTYTFEPKAEPAQVSIPRNLQPSGPLVITLDTQTSEGVYAALFPIDIQNDFYFNVNGSDGTYTGTAKAKLKDGSFYNVQLTMTKE